MAMMYTEYGIEGDIVGERKNLTPKEALSECKQWVIKKKEQGCSKRSVKAALSSVLSLRGYDDYSFIDFVLKNKIKQFIEKEFEEIEMEW
jgi:hypothetical protein